MTRIVDFQSGYGTNRLHASSFRMCWTHFVVKRSSQWESWIFAISANKGLQICEHDPTSASFDAASSRLFAAGRDSVKFRARTRTCCFVWKCVAERAESSSGCAALWRPAGRKYSANNCTEWMVVGIRVLSTPQVTTAASAAHRPTNFGRSSFTSA